MSNLQCLFCSGGNLYKRERKKRQRKLSERISESLEAKQVCDSPSTEPEPAPDLGDLSDPSSDPSGPDDDVVPIYLSDTIKHYLELDNQLVTQDNKVSISVSLASSPILFRENINLVFNFI